MHELGVRTVLPVLCRLQTKGLASAKFAVNNKVHSTTKISSFMANYGRELRIRGDIRRKGKVEKATKFIEKLKRVQEEVRTALKRTQEEMKRYIDQNRKEMEEWKKEDRVMLSTKDLVFKERPVYKLVERYVGLYEVEEVILSNTVKLQLSSSIRIHPVVNVSWVVQYREQVKEQKKEEEKPVKVEGVEKWEVKRILKKREDLKNTKELVEDFERKISTKIRK